MRLLLYAHLTRGRRYKQKLNILKSEEPPVLILISTDGYHNSFISVEEFKKVGLDYFKLDKYLWF